MPQRVGLESIRFFRSCLLNFTLITVLKFKVRLGVLLLLRCLFSNSTLQNTWHKMKISSRISTKKLIAPSMQQPSPLPIINVLLKFRNINWVVSVRNVSNISSTMHASGNSHSNFDKIEITPLSVIILRSIYYYFVFIWNLLFLHKLDNMKRSA